MRFGGSARGPWRARRTRKVHCANHGTNQLSSGRRALMQRANRLAPLAEPLHAAFSLPTRAPRYCSHSGCRALVKGGYCPAHARPRFEGVIRGSAAQRGYGHAWRKARAGYLAAHPLCVECEGGGRLTPATVVDHRAPHRGDRALFWDRNNWQPLCARCHDRKTARGE